MASNDFLKGKSRNDSDQLPLGTRDSLLRADAIHGKYKSVAKYSRIKRHVKLLMNVSDRLNIPSK